MISDLLCNGVAVIFERRDLLQHIVVLGTDLGAMCAMFRQP